MSESSSAEQPTTIEQSAPVTTARVGVLKVNAGNVIERYKELLRSLDYQKFLPKENDTALKINISWAKFYPACSTTPWQLDAVIQCLLEDGYSKDLVHACHNNTVVVNSKVGERKNKHIRVVRKHGLRNVHLYEGEPWDLYEPKGEFLVLDKVYPDGVHIPRRFHGENIIHLPTMKTHVFTTMTGAMKNAFGGLLDRQRHWTHSVIHETLVDLLMIQKEVHGGIFAVMDGSVVGDGPGPRCMVAKDAGYILASDDQVAIDAVSAQMMGFNPMDLKFIRLAHEKGLGIGEPKDIEIVGDPIEGVNFNCQKADTFASRGQHMLYHGILKPVERLMTHSPLVVLTYLASWAYHDWYWYPMIGSKRVAEYMKTEWGGLFRDY